jgi:hypothetical protein
MVTGGVLQEQMKQDGASAWPWPDPSPYVILNGLQPVKDLAHGGESLR